MKLGSKNYITFLLASTLLLFTACKPSGDDPPSGGGADGGVFEPDSTLMDSVIADLESGRGCFGPGITVSWNLEMIEKGNIPIYLDFTDCKTYFVAAYYDPEASEVAEYRSMTWIGFKNADNILEYYEGLHLLLAYQVDESSVYDNLLTAQADSGSVSVYLNYQPVFVNGVNVEAANTYLNGKKFIYTLGDSYNGLYYEYTVSDSGDMYMLKYCIDERSLNCVTVDGRNYICVSVGRVMPDGSIYEHDLISELRAYYDDFIDLMITGVYSETASDGTVCNYGLIPLEDYIRFINEQKAEI